MNAIQTEVVNLRDYQGVDLEAAEIVKIDRTTIFGNPFIIGRDGTREEVIAKYKHWFWNRIKEDWNFEREVISLWGYKLGCWCKPLACHGDVIKAFLEWRCDEDGNWDVAVMPERKRHG